MSSVVYRSFPIVSCFALLGSTRRTHSSIEGAAKSLSAEPREVSKSLASLLLALHPKATLIAHSGTAGSMHSDQGSRSRSPRNVAGRVGPDRAAQLTSMNSAGIGNEVSRRVAVIGGGSAGVTAARFLQRAGHKPRIFEAGSSFGGVWADTPTNNVVYKNLKTNLPTCVMQSPDLDFPPGCPSYITKQQLGSYIENYAREFGLMPIATFGANVTRVKHVGANTDEDLWKVEWTCNGTSHVDTFDAVVIGNGHYEEPYKPALPGDAEWLAADVSRTIIHSREYNDPEEFRGQSVLVVGARSSGFDVARELNGIAKWVYILEKKCSKPVMYDQEAVTHVPLGTRLCSDGRLRIGDLEIAGPPVETVVLATGYLYAFPFLDEATLGMRFSGQRFVTPLYRHVIHAKYPTLGFIGIPLAIPCPIPFFEVQAAYLAAHWSRPSSGPDALTSVDEREAWVHQRRTAVGNRTQDIHLTSAAGGSAWDYMRELLGKIHAVRPTTAEGESWIERFAWDVRLRTVEEVYLDRVKRQPKLPWQDDVYRRCEYSVDWERARWSVDDHKPPPSVEYVH